MDGDDWGRLAYLVILLVAVGGWVLVQYRTRLGQALRTAMAWGLIFVGVMAGYGLWEDLRRDSFPQQLVSQSGRIEVPRSPDGHYYLTLQVNGMPVRFLADTGATNVVLGRDDAETLGLDPASLDFVGIAQTANGPVRTARVTLPEVRLGPVTDTEVGAYVNDGEMDGSLLGMDYLGLWRIEIDRDRMVLTR